MSRAFNIGLICKSCPSSTTLSSVRPREKRTQSFALDSRLRGNERSLLLTPFVPAKAGTQRPLATALGPGSRFARPGHENVDSRLRGNERSLLLTPFVPAKAGRWIHIRSATVCGTSLPAFRSQGTFVGCCCRRAGERENVGARGLQGQ